MAVLSVGIGPFSPSHFDGRRAAGRRNCSFSTQNRIFVVSSHSNPKIVKSNRKSRHGRVLSPYDSDEDGSFVDDDDEYGYDDELAAIKISKADRQRLKSKMNSTGFIQGNHRHTESTWNSEPFKSGNEGKMGIKTGESTSEKRKIGTFHQATSRSTGSSSLHSDGKGEEEEGSCVKERFSRLSEELGLDDRCFPLFNYLSTFGFKDSHFIQMYERHMPFLQINVASAQERLGYLLSIGVKHKDIRKIILRQPQILEYTVESNLKYHVDFLTSLGIPDSKIGRIVTATPSLFSYSVENSLKPTVRYLLEEVGIKKNELSKILQLSPQILVQRIDSTWTTRFNFLTKELGAPRDSIVKMVTKHPQLLHYSIEGGLLPRINFLRSIGMRDSDILKVLTSITQVFSLSLEGNLKPKYMYLVNELKNEVHSLTKYPTYLSLSLDQRIRPRHRFLISLKKAPKGPFPLSSLVPTDECFCQQWAGTTLETYLNFRQRLLYRHILQAKMANFQDQHTKRIIIELIGCQV
nr:transcription termination factor MTERF9, chloroplastic [Ipomoea batatas]